jgi:transcription elongation factor GreA
MAKNTVTLNSKVTVNCNNIEKSYFIVRSEELESTSTQISNISPLGKLLLNSNVKDVIKVQTPSGEIEYEVVSVETKKRDKEIVTTKS